MLKNRSIATIITIWLGWFLVLYAFQGFVSQRMQLQRPDYALSWTPHETGRNSQNDKPYLLDPFLNAQVAWDSEYYISISINGYDDPDGRVIYTPSGKIALNYAFFPLYGLAIRILSAPLSIFGLTTIATATLAGVIISLVGTLGGMIALYDIVREKSGEDSGIQAAFYMLIFPTSFFLAMVYTEGLFVGLAFGSLAFMRRKQFLFAAVLAALATWTRAAGALLALPLFLTWAEDIDWRTVVKQRQLPPIHKLIQVLWVLAPLIAYGVWYLTLGEKFTIVEENFFGRGFLAIEQSFQQWSSAWQALLNGEIQQQAAYYLIEFSLIAFAFLASIFTLRRYPKETIFGLSVLVLSFTSGSAQSMARYVITIPAIYLVLAQLGRYQAFDRIWTFGSGLLQGLLVTLFTFDMWVA